MRSATPSSGLVETPRVEVTAEAASSSVSAASYRNNFAAVLLSCDVDWMVCEWVGDKPKTVYVSGVEYELSGLDQVVVNGPRVGAPMYV